MSQILNIKQLEDYHINDYYVNDMLWNIVLIIVPVLLYFAIKRWWYFSRGGFGNRILVLILLFTWFLFLPNTAYVMTDVRHLIDYCPPTEFDVCPVNSWMPMFFFAYSLIGWISFFWLINSFADMISFKMNKIYSFVFVILAIPLSALGVLLGLLDRLNSWDVITRPSKVYETALSYFTNPALIRLLFIYSIIFLFLYGLGWLFLNKKTN